jgi:glycosyltransferase involved in cell wall biosynthesis
MKIAFVAASTIPFHASSLEQRPLGGTETAVIRLATALQAAGAHVRVLVDLPNPPLSQPLYLPFSAAQDLGPVDALIVVRNWEALSLPVQAKRRYFWTGDSYDQPITLGLGDPRVVRYFDAFLAVSDWQADQMCRHSGFPRDRTWILRNGVHLEYFSGREQRHPQRLIYTSMPWRGLALVPTLYQELLKTLPALELQVCSGYEVYQGSTPPPQHLVREFEQVCAQLRPLSGVALRGNIPQQELAREFMRASLFFYPNTFEETSCISALEAQAAGTPCISSARGALPETIGDAGILIEGEPGSPEYMQRFAAAAHTMLSDPLQWQQYSQRALARAKKSDWQLIAGELLQYLAARQAG